MRAFRSLALAAGLIASLAVAPTATAGVGDLLVAPTRVILNGGRGTEIILKNVGDATATYRVSAEFRRMTPDGRLAAVAEPNGDEKAAEEMVIFAPRKVTLPPGEPQSIRISARAPAGLADGEYRIHLLFRAIPDPKPVGQPAQSSTVAFQLIPIYGVTIPVIVRLGKVEAKAAIADVRHVTGKDGEGVSLTLSRSGNRSLFGEVRVLKAGVKDPVAIAKGVAIYREIDRRSVAVPRAPGYSGALSGPVTVQFYETTDSGAVLTAETSAVL
ncbi:molecular chaperone [Sphingomonas mesophila]|uniref:fimbrial biogenesis chaperone n=1 Tax=Sphingomonas mesophila TaxID=2303576 RepID=UPI000E58BF69|nr:molecular chaperone [Sphingomonas mesophila]